MTRLHLEAELDTEGSDSKEPRVECVVVPEGVAEYHWEHKQRHRHQQDGKMAPERRDVGGAEGHQDRVGHAVDEVQDGRQQKAHVSAQTDLRIEAGEALSH